jgi:hypothetical protein
MSLSKPFWIGMMLLTGTQVWAAEGVISSVPDAAGKYCLLKFPAIQEDTLYWPRPVLKAATTGDIVEYYGPCDYDPLGREEILRQRGQYQDLRRRRLPEGE